MIDLGHGYIGGKVFNNFIKTKIPDYKEENLRDYSTPGGDKELLKILEVFFGLKSINNITLTLSTNLSFNIICNKFLNENKNIHIFKPTFSCFLSQTKNIDIHSVHFHANNDFNSIYENANKGDMVLLINPSNPLGSYISENELFDIMKKMNEKGIVMVIDSTRLFSIYNINNHIINTRNIIERTLKYNHIILIGLSKILYSPGIRLSTVIGNEEIINYTKNNHDALAVSCSYFDQEYAKTNISLLMEEKGINYNKINDILLNNLQEILKFINQSKFLTVKSIPDAGIFLTITITINININDMITQTEVIVYPSNIFGSDDSSFRICIANDIEYILSGLKKIDYYLNNL